MFKHPLAPLFVCKTYWIKFIKSTRLPDMGIYIMFPVWNES